MYPDLISARKTKNKSDREITYLMFSAVPLPVAASAGASATADIERNPTFLFKPNVVVCGVVRNANAMLAKANKANAALIPFIIVYCFVFNSSQVEELLLSKESSRIVSRIQSAFWYFMWPTQQQRILVDDGDRIDQPRRTAKWWAAKPR